MSRWLLTISRDLFRLEFRVDWLGCNFCKGVQLMSANKTLLTRELGRTRRRVTTFGLGGQSALMLTPEGVDPVAIIEKAFRLGVTYFDTSNAYGPSQGHYGSAFRKLGLVPGTANYDRAARESIYFASKTHLRTTRHPDGRQWRNDYSDGMKDGVTTAVDDVRRTLSLVFGDGKGQYPEGAYLDCIQIHNLTAQDDVDMVYEGLNDPSPAAPWLGALAGLLDLREGTNRSGTNPRLEKLVRHIGITGHWNSAAHIYAIQRDALRILDTLLVALNPGDLNLFCHQHNAIPVAQAAGMGVIGMKVFADASYYGEPATFMRDVTQVYRRVGSESLPSAPFVQYTLSTSGVTACIIGIGQIDSSDDPTKCQLTANVQAAQIEKPLSEAQRTEIESQIGSAGLGTIGTFFQRSMIGLTPPRNVGAESDPGGFSPVTPNIRPAVRVTWDTAYAGRYAVERYEVLRDGKVVGTVPHKPQWTSKRFIFEDTFANDGKPQPGDTAKHGVISYKELDEGRIVDQDPHRPQWTLQQRPSADPVRDDDVGAPVYVVRAVDTGGGTAESGPFKVVL
jgi:aryl-alcohol dehydrogenase-like predicted oxidoreductase